MTKDGATSDGKVGILSQTACENAGILSQEIPYFSGKMLHFLVNTWIFDVKTFMIERRHIKKKKH